MTGFKIKDWVQKQLAQAKTWGKQGKARFTSLTGAMQTIVGTLRNPTIRQNVLYQIRERTTAMSNRLKDGKVWLLESADSLHWHIGGHGHYSHFRFRVLGSLGLAAIIWTGSLGFQQYVEAHTYEIYRVYVKDQFAGTVSSPQVVDEFKITKYKKLEEEYPNVHMILNADEIVLKGEKAYRGEADDSAAVSRLEELVTAQAVGVELTVNGKVVGIVKDKDTAEQILNKVKAKYGGASAAENQEKGKVSILSAEKSLSPGESQVQEVDFVEAVELKQKDIAPDQLLNPDDMLKKLETGDVQPTKYTVEKGDCVSLIAKKFNISKQVVYENNPWIVDDAIKAGQVLDLTVMQPTLSVKTVEKVVERQEIQYETEYVKDDTMRAGVVQTLNRGQNGVKNVTFLVTKVNGKWMEEKMLNEEIIKEPVKAVAKKGTKVILGEGSGKFSWPVLGSSVSSGFGNRWGKLHKGVDLTGNRSILASDNGKVEYVGYKTDYGNHIIINHMNGYKTLYGHLSAMDVKVGQVVEKGERIGTMGSTGDSTGVHLHFEVLKNGIPENPLKYLNR